MIAATAPPPVNSANRTATELIGRDYLSFSAMRLYQKCPLAFWFKYVGGMQEETVSSSLVFGTAVHSAVEFHFNELMTGNRPPSVDLLLGAFWAAWHARENQTIRFGKGEDINSIGRLAERVLSTFLESDFAHQHGEILAVEEELRGSVIPDAPDLLARIDLVVETDADLIVSDLKTARTRWSKGQASDAGEQLLLYSELARELAPDKQLRLQFSVVTKTKTPVLETHTVAADTHRIERIKRVVQQVWQAIEHRHFYPAPSPMNCPTCPFRGPCQTWGD